VHLIPHNGRNRRALSQEALGEVLALREWIEMTRFVNGAP
jgi:hypothetical protein